MNFLVVLPTPKHQRYFDRYLKLIFYAIKNPVIGYTERHHIFPKSMGGDPKDLSNIIRLSARQHFLAHYLLWKAYRNRSMTRAFQFLSNRNGRKIKSRDYAIFKEGMTHSVETKRRLSAALTGKKRAPFTEETKSKMRKPKSEETRLKMCKPKSDETKIRMRKPKSEETRAKMSKASKLREAKKRLRLVRIIGACG